MAILAWITVVLEAVLCVRLILTGLWRGFRIFTAYLAIAVVRDVDLLGFTRANSHGYEIVWAFSGLVLLTLQVAVVFELFGRVEAQLPRLGAAGVKILSFITAAAAITAMLTVWFDLGKPLARSRIQAAYTLAQRDLGLALGLIAVGSVAVFYPFRVRLKRNTVFHGWILGVYFGAGTVIFALMNLEWIGRVAAGYAILLTAIICYSAWIVLLRPTNESMPVQLAPLSAEQVAEVERREQALLDIDGRRD